MTAIDGSRPALRLPVTSAVVAFTTILIPHDLSALVA
jgi:hypothetical protein